uniref:Odorant binding protein 9 n=1 Tax=Apolygus lucorum TaxID=248454 RepID=D4P932_APOLU|nr:odorant-binding protein 1 [Apolygus lucorum]AFJ54050.1 odorant binding protein 9 [Apolygus lucorum]
MKSFVGLIFAVALVEFASAITKEYHDRAVAAKDACLKKHPSIKESDVQEFLKKHKLPETDDGKCMIACYMEEMNLMADGKINVEEAKKTNSDKYDGEPDNKELADKLIDHCSSQVSPDGMSKCEYAYQISKCGLEYGMKNGLTPPKMYEEQRR